MLRSALHTTGLPEGLYERSKARKRRKAHGPHGRRGTRHMAKCQKCGSVLASDEHRKYHDLLLCEDCYLDQVHRPTLKAESKNGRVNFLLRLKETYTLKKQDID